MMATKDLTVTFYVGGERVDKLTEEHKERIAQKFGEALSLYYSQHPSEYKKIQSKT